MKYRILFLGVILCAASLTTMAEDAEKAQLDDIAIERGPFEPKWQSLSAWECPEWFKDANSAFGLTGDHSVRPKPATGTDVECMNRTAVRTNGTLQISAIRLNSV